MLCKEPKINNFSKALEQVELPKEFVDKKNKPKPKKKLSQAEKDELYYFSSQELVFSEFITNPEQVTQREEQPWQDNLFLPQPYNVEFWDNYNILLESKEEAKMRKDLEKKVHPSIC